MTTVVVGMSGGVDSSVSAWLLKEQGYHVIGLFAKSWEETSSDGVCQSSREFQDVEAVCNQIGIPYYSVNLVDEYREQVFAQFLADYKAGLTPNPDILCNREIKFKALYQKALDLGAAFLATGHYCRVQRDHEKSLLLKGLDPEKDQSYFLYAISQNALHRTLFPIGELLKSQVRELARKAHLPTAEKRDSTGICFIGERNFKKFLSGYLACQKGPLMTLEGQEVGTHDGCAFYTIGQRKGLGLGGEGDAWFVVKKNPLRNIVYVAQGKDHPALFCDELTARSLNWIYRPPFLPFRCTAKIRYRQKDVPCIVESSEDGVCVHFDQPQRAITLGQSVVFYDNEIMLGGGVIHAVAPSEHEKTHSRD